MKNTYSVAALLKISLPVVASDSFVNKKGEVVIIGNESLYAIDYHTLTATAKPFNFALAKVAREAFAKAIQGEFFARELAKVEAEAAKIAAIDESYFIDARESHTAEEIAEARAKVDVMRKRINAARDFISPFARESGNTTIKAIVSAIRGESVPAQLAKAADDMRSEARKIDDIVHTTFAPAEVERARAIMSNRESYGESIVAEAAAFMAKYDLSEGITETLPNMRALRESITKYIEALWNASPAEGIEKINIKASHALTVEVFQRARNARSITKAGNVHSTFAAADDIAREAALALVEVLQGKAREAAAEAKAREAAEAKAAEAKAAAKAEAAREAAEAKAAEAAKAKAEAEAKAAEAKAAAKAAKRKGTKAAEAAKAIKAAAAEAAAEAAAAAEAKAEAAAKVKANVEAAAREAAAK